MHACIKNPRWIECHLPKKYFINQKRPSWHPQLVASFNTVIGISFFIYKLALKIIIFWSILTTTHESSYMLIFHSSRKRRRKRITITIYMSRLFINSGNFAVCFKCWSLCLANPTIPFHRIWYFLSTVLDAQVIHVTWKSASLAKIGCIHISKTLSMSSLLS